MDADAPPPRTWTKGSFAGRYLGFLWRGVVAGMVAMYLFGPLGVVWMSIWDATLLTGIEDHLSGVAMAMVALVYGMFVWVPLAVVVVVIPTLFWSRIKVPLTRGRYWGLLLGFMGMGLAAELCIMAAMLDSTYKDWKAVVFYFHGTGILPGLAVFLWTPEAKEYRRRRKAERRAGMPT